MPPAGTAACRREQALRQTVVWERAHPPATVPPEAFDYVAEAAALAAAGTG